MFLFDIVHNIMCSDEGFLPTITLWIVNSALSKPAKAAYHVQVVYRTHVAMPQPFMQ